jgi:hypothetical protein
MRAVGIVNILLGAAICFTCLAEAAGKPPIEFGIALGNALIGALGVILGLRLWIPVNARQAIAAGHNQPGKRLP